ncbi:diguanylate cyclase [Labedaea rhizosphaerae]|uniref:diguanylate cyclase n=1 Tax=Labedaea rhizosphaerae TaxID=598644 RepID=UPI001FB6E254|nr:diguanylate cyclase [Labedaea rhizosphaerae]
MGYLSIGALSIVCYYLIPPDGAGVVVRVVMYCLTSMSAAVAVFVGILRNRPRPWLAWAFLGASQLVYAVADSTFYLRHYLLDLVDYPSVADPLYLAHYPLVVCALVLLIRHRTPGRDIPGLIDAAVLAVVAAMLSWLYLIAPQARADSPMLVKVTSVAYPVMDLAMLAVALRLILGTGRRPPSFMLLSGNLLAIFAADTIYVGQQLDGTYQTGNWLDALWLVGNLSLGAAALHPTMRWLGDPSPVADQRLGPVRIMALCVAALVAPATLLVRGANEPAQDLPVIAAACAILFLLAIARLAALVADQRRLAITDGLTGLHTRRFFEAQLTLEVQRARRSGAPLAVIIVDIDRFKSINDEYGHPAGDAALVEVATRLRTAARAGDVIARYGGEEFALLLPGASPEDLPAIAQRLREQVASSPIAVAGDCWLAVTVSIGVASYPDHGHLEGGLIAVADRALYAAKSAGRDRVVVGVPSRGDRHSCDEDAEMVEFLFRTADEVDAALSNYQHSKAISLWAMVMASELGADLATIRRAALAGRLHDIGKIVIPASILAKPAALDAEEWRVMREHPDHGYRIAAVVPGFEEVAQSIRQHHERYDGSGYPQGLSGRCIRLEARLIAVCDAWAAMLSDRPYHVMRTPEQARQELIRGRGSQFDPDVVDLFLALEASGRVGRLSRLDGSESAGLFIPPTGTR